MKTFDEIENKDFVTESESESKDKFPAENVERVNRIKQIFNLKKDKDVAELLGVQRSQITRMKQTGFYPMHRRLIDLLLDKIDKKKKA